MRKPAKVQEIAKFYPAGRSPLIAPRLDTNHIARNQIRPQRLPQLYFTACTNNPVVLHHTHQTARSARYPNHPSALKPTVVKARKTGKTENPLINHLLNGTLGYIPRLCQIKPASRISQNG